MYKKCLVLFSLCFLFGMETLDAQVPARKLDTTIKVGKAGPTIGTTDIKRRLAFFAYK